MRNPMFVIALLSASLQASVSFAEIVRFMEVAPGIYRGGQPTTVEDYETLKAIGIKTIINLRDDLLESESQIASDFGLNYTEFPLNTFAYPEDEMVFGALDALTNPKLQPTFVHCQHGKDRTGLLIGLYRVKHEGWSREKAYIEMKKYGFSPMLMNLRLFLQVNSPPDTQ